MSGRAAAPVAAILLLLSGCGGSLTESRSGTANFESGKTAYDRHDYVEAALDLKAYVEQYPGTDKTDDALYYLGLTAGVLAQVAYDRLKHIALGAARLRIGIRCELQSHALTIHGPALSGSRHKVNLVQLSPRKQL